MVLHAVVACLLPTLIAAEPAVFPRGHVFFAADFEGRDTLKGWVGPGVLGEGFQGGQALVLERPAEKGPGYAAGHDQVARWRRCVATSCSSRRGSRPKASAASRSRITA